MRPMPPPILCRPTPYPCSRPLGTLGSADMRQAADTRLPAWSRRGANTGATQPSGPVEAVLERYRLYLTLERGLGARTARGYVDAVRLFLHGRTLPDGLAPWILG